MPYIHQSEAWARSIYPPAPIINGVQLLPLCIGHLIHMETMGILERFANFGSVGGAVVEAIAVCSQSFEDVIFKVNSGVWEDDVKEVGKYIFNGDTEEAIRAFREYMDDSQELPAYLQSQKSGGSQSGSHWAMSIKLSLQSELRLTESEILNRPLTQCIAEHYAIAERNGSLQLLSQEQADMSKRAKEDEAMILELVKKARCANG